LGGGGVEAGEGRSNDWLERSSAQELIGGRRGESWGRGHDAVVLLGVRGVVLQGAQNLFGDRRRLGEVFAEGLEAIVVSDVLDSVLDAVGAGVRVLASYRLDALLGIGRFCQSTFSVRRNTVFSVESGRGAS